MGRFFVFREQIYAKQKGGGYMTVPSDEHNSYLIYWHNMIDKYRRIYYERLHYNHQNIFRKQKS